MLVTKTVQNGFPIPNAAESRDGFPHRFERRRSVDLRPEPRIGPVRRRVGNFFHKERLGNGNDSKTTRTIIMIIKREEKVGVWGLSKWKWELK